MLMLYAYSLKNPSWNSERKFEFLKSLRFLLESRTWSLSGMEPYAELVGDQLRIYRLNHLSDESLDELVKEADVLFAWVINTEYHTGVANS